MMRVDIVQFDGCPNVGPTVERVRDVAARLGIEIDLRLVRIESSEEAVRERFSGSPTVRVNGIDIDPTAQFRSDFGLSCRVYDGAGIPSEGMIVAALTEETAPHRRTPAGLVTSGSIIAAALSSACCWLPLLLVAAGLSAGGLAQAFAPLRPWLIALAVLLLAFAIWLNERPSRRAVCDCQPVLRRRRRLNRAMLAISAFGVFGFSLFPQYVGNVFGGRLARDVAPRGGNLTLRVDGMTCAGCAAGIEAAVLRLPGVVLADATYEKGVLLVAASPGFALQVDDLVRAVAQAGYTAYDEGTKAARDPVVGTPTSLRVVGDDLDPVADAFNSASAPFRFLAILSPT